MSKGNKTLGVRVDAETLAEIEAALKRAEWYSRGVAPTVGDWLRSAIKEKLAKQRRNRENARKRSYRRDDK